MDPSPEVRKRVNVFEQIDSICRGFRKGLKRGEIKPISHFLAQVDDRAKENLFRNLLHIEVEFRRKEDDHPTSDEYIQRFPQYKKVVRQAFFESTMMSIDDIKETPTGERLVTFSLPAATRLGEYEILEELGRGGFGVVYKARHQQRKHIVALKTLPTEFRGDVHPLKDAERLHKFRREFRSLAEMNHPNLVGMQTLEVDGEQWFFTMDLIDGVDILTYLRPNGIYDEARIRSTMPQLINGILALHARHILHRDLKPSNVLVDKDGRVKILDFGLVAELDQRADQPTSVKTTHFAGTPRYAAPEQMFGSRTTASDWYSIGIILYEALSNTAPFRGSNAEILVKKKNEDPPTIGTRGDLPPDLAQLADQLIRRDPEERPDALTIAKIFSVQVESLPPEGGTGDGDSAAGTSELVLVGREQQQNQLNTAHEALLATQKPTVVFISGRSGEGKTSLAESFLRPLRDSDELVVLSGRCYDRESVPFKAIDCMIDALCAQLRQMKFEEVLPFLPDDVQLLASMFPVMRRVEAIGQWPNVGSSSLDSEQIRFRGFKALRDLLHRIAIQKPLVIFIDDLQWGDSDSASVMTDLLTPVDPIPLLFIGSYRVDESDDSPFLQEWRRLESSKGIVLQSDIHVGPLDEPQCIELVTQRIGQDTPAIRHHAKELFESTGGNPYFLDQLIDCYDASTGTFTPAPINEVIESKLENLSSGARPLLELLAVCGQAMLVSEVAEIAGQSADPISTLTHMRNERLVRLIGSEEQQLVDTYHDKIRESILDEMNRDNRKAYHLRIAEAIETLESIDGSALLSKMKESGTFGETDAPQTRRLFDLAYHFFAARDERAFLYQLLSGELCHESFALEDSAEHLEHANEMLRDTYSKGAKYRLWEQKGRVALRLRDCDHAYDCYERAVELAGNSVQRARAHRGAGLVHAQLANFDEAESRLDEALLQLSRPRPRSTFVSVLKSSWLIFKVVVLPRFITKRFKPDTSEVSQRERETLVELAFFAYESNYFAGIYTIVREGYLAVRSGDNAQIAGGYGALGSVLSLIGILPLARLCLRRTSKITDESNAPEQRARLLFWRGNYSYGARKLADAVESFDASADHARQCGMHALLCSSAHLARHVHAITSTSSKEFDAAHLELEYSEAADNTRGRCWGFYGQANALARKGALKDAHYNMRQAYANLSREQLYLTEAICKGTDGYVLLQDSKYDEAQPILEDSWEIVEKNTVYMDYTVRTLGLLLECLAGPNWTDARVYPNRKRIKRLVRKCVLMYSMFPNLRSPIQRGRGRVLFSRGKTRKAIRCFENAVRVAEGCGAHYDHARALLDLAAVVENERDANRKQAIKLLKQTESVIPHSEQWQLGTTPDTEVVASPS